MQDDAKQSPLANKLVESLTVDAPGFIALVSVVELAWVLSSAYQLDRPQLTAVLEGLMRTKELIVERAEIIWQAVRVFRGTSADFADCLIERSAMSAGCDGTMTFDRGAAKNCGMTLIS
jgi:predicted nucleic-acid-binding protein